MTIHQRSWVKAVLASLLLVGSAAAQKHVSFPTQDGGLVYGDAYGEGARGVVLAHGGRFNKESWRSRREYLKRRDSTCWRSTFEVTVSLEVRASPIPSAPRSSSTYWPPSAICERRAPRQFLWLAEAWEVGPRPMPR